MAGFEYELCRWFQKHQRILPWRDNPSPYRVWISEIMLQQTQVATVVPYFERFIDRFPTVHALAQAGSDEVLSLWSGLGYYSRARNLHRAAVEISKADFPTDREGWEALPGVGPYTAGAILSLAYGEQEAILDGNIERVLCRVHALKEPLREIKKQLWALSREHLEKAVEKRCSPSDFNQAFMELGAKICTPKSPKCQHCPVRKFCKAFHAETVDMFPVKGRSKEWKKVDEQVYVLYHRGNFLLHRQEKGKWREGLWDFPKKLPQSLSKSVSRSRKQIEIRYVVTRHKVKRKGLLLKLRTDQKACFALGGIDESNYRWVSAKDLEKRSQLPFGSPTVKTWRKAVAVLSDLK